MAIITFWNDNTGKIGQTHSALAIASYMGVEHNYKVLLMTTKNDEKVTMKAFGSNQISKTIKALTQNKLATVELESGIEGMSKLASSSRLTPEIVPNYTKVVFKDRLEVVALPKKKADIDYNRLYDSCKNILTVANRYYDIILLDLNNGLKQDTTKEILKMSNVIILNIEQKPSEIEKVKQIYDNKELFPQKKLMTLINNYDRKSKYSAKNIGRELGKGQNVLTVPYCNLFSESIEEGVLPELFLGLRARGFEGNDNRTSFFISELKRASEAIIYRMQELQMMI